MWMIYSFLVIYNKVDRETLWEGLSLLTGSKMRKTNTSKDPDLGIDSFVIEPHTFVENYNIIYDIETSYPKKDVPSKVHELI